MERKEKDNIHGKFSLTRARRSVDESIGVSLLDEVGVLRVGSDGSSLGFSGSFMGQNGFTSSSLGVSFSLSVSIDSSVHQVGHLLGLLVSFHSSLMLSIQDLFGSRYCCGVGFFRFLFGLLGRTEETGVLGLLTLLQGNGIVVLFLGFLSSSRCECASTVLG